ncbi:hypothetical protein S518_005001 [Salmonella enterica subsp. enterica]|nr:hypothetical protein [Salmonella enterica subsp. enterica]
MPRPSPGPPSLRHYPIFQPPQRYLLEALKTSHTGVIQSLGTPFPL